MRASLLHDLALFDGRNPEILQDVYHAHLPPSGEVLDALVDAVGDEDANMQTGASWLLRYYVQEGHALDSRQIGRLAGSLDAMPDGFGRLHLCHAIGPLTVPARHADAFAAFFRDSARTSANTFVRAWATHAFYRLAQQHDRFMAEARALVEAALTDPAASVRARARKTVSGE